MQIQKNMIILVTGGEGQLASCLKDKVSESNNKWIFLSKKEMDITKVESVDNILKKYEPNVIINCAAYTNVDKAVNEAGKAFLINELGPLHLAICAKHYGARVIHISSDFVFDGTKNTPYNENDKTNPISIYGKSKLAGEKVVLKYNNSTVIRTSWLYSEYGNNFFKTMFNRIITKEKTFVVNDQIGTPTYAMDLANFLFYTVENNLSNLENKIYHFSNEGCASWYDFAKTIELFLIENISNYINEDIINPISTNGYNEIIGKTLEKRPAYSVLNKEELNKIVEYKNRHWISALYECIDKYLKQNYCK